MKIDANDPKWTAYALGEITDEKERAEILGILEESAEARQLVESIRQTAGLLKAELQAEPAIALTEAQRKRIDERASTRGSWIGMKPAWVMSFAAAAMLILSFVTVRHLRRIEAIPPNEQVASLTSKESLQTPRSEMESPAVVTSPRALGNADQIKVKKNEEVAAPAVAEKLKAADSTQQAALPSDKPEPSVPAAPVQPVPATVSQTATKSAVLEGTVKDKFGGVLPGVEIKVTDDSTGSTAQTVTNQAGQYAFPALSPGLHTLTAELSGFQHTTLKDVALNASSPTKLDVNMEIGKLQQTVEIRAASPPVTTYASSLASAPGKVQKDGTAMNGVRYRRPLPIPPPRPLQIPPPRPPHKSMWPPWQKPRGDFNTEAYDNISDNPFLDVTQNPLSTFSIDVDTASYSNMRRFLDNGSLPPKDSIRIEELVNYFDYDYKGPKDGKPFAANFEITEAPWKPGHKLLRIGLKGREVDSGKRPDSNLVFLLDVSGSMADENKLPLVKQAMNLLLDQLTEADRVAIVVYASDTSLFLPSTSGDQKEKLRHAIERLHAGGSTNGASGIKLAYQTAKENFIKGGVNRVILATDGDFNVGITNRGDLTRLIEEKAESGIYLSVLGFGMGNYKDATLELLANKGRGNYAYIDNINEAKKVLAEQINSTLVTIAKDVKIQVEFNPRRVSAYRLIGYEDRLMAKEDFNDDTKQAGAIGAGHAVTVLYELVPAGVSESIPGVDQLKYQKPAQPSSSADSDELLTIKIRSKDPEKNKSVLSEFTVKDSKEKFSNASEDFKFAASVAAFGMVLRNSPYKGSANMESALDWAKEGKGDDVHGYRQEFIRLIHRAISISF
jgi:Ca-activated chloride channel family protein